jgi:hypothetical protein
MYSELGFGFATRGKGKGDGWKTCTTFFLMQEFALIVSTSLCTIFTD